MPQIFTVRWPHFARLEAVLFFPLALMLAIERTSLRPLVERLPIDQLAHRVAAWGLDYRDVLWGAMALAAALPYLAGLMVVDRLLTVRKGYALLSILAIVDWTMAGTALSFQVIPYVERYADGVADWLTMDWNCGLAVGAIAFFLHIPALWIGARDRGEVAEYLIGETGADDYDRRAGSDVYRRQTADFRRWRAPDHDLDMPAAPREHLGVLVLYAVAWIGVVAGAGAVYSNRSDLAAAIASAGETRDRGPAVAGPKSPGVRQKTAVATPVQSHAPAAPAVATVIAGTLPVAGGMAHVYAIPPPAAQSDASRAGPNEAISERAIDGMFVFDATVNGVRFPMSVDPDAPSVVLRAEDASRLGLNLARLGFTARARTPAGEVEAAPAMLETVAVGNIVARNVPAMVVRPGALRESILGQGFLSRLVGRTVDNNRLILKGR